MSQELRARLIASEGLCSCQRAKGVQDVTSLLAVGSSVSHLPKPMLQPLNFYTLLLPSERGFGVSLTGLNQKATLRSTTSKDFPHEGHEGLSLETM